MQIMKHAVVRYAWLVSMMGPFYMTQQATVVEVIWESL